MLDLPSKIIIFDTEYTTWEGAMERKWGGPHEYKEIVQIGAVKIETDGFGEIDALNLFVRPEKNPKLSDYFTKLTGITQEKIENDGTNFKTALEKFYPWSDGLDLYCFGSDGEVLKLNCDLYHIPFPFDPARFNDVREVFERAGIATKGYMSSTIIEAFGNKKTRQGHDGLDDARTIVDGLRCLQERENMNI